MAQLLPGIIKIQAVKAAQLPADISLRHQVGLPLTIVGDFAGTPILGTSTGTLTSKYDHNYYVQTAEIAIRTTERLRFSDRMAFVITTVNGNSFLLGTKEPPYPILLEGATFGKPDEESSCYDYTLSYVSPQALRECVTY